MTVLQAHHAVQTLPEVGPEFTQAIVQTDISGPITASELTSAGLSHTKFVKPAADLQTSVVSQGDGSHATVDQTSLEAVQTVDTRPLGGHQSLVQDELQVEASDAKEGGSKQAALPHHPTSGRDEDSNVASTNQAFSSPPFQGRCCSTLSKLNSSPVPGVYLVKRRVTVNGAQVAEE